MFVPNRDFKHQLEREAGYRSALTTAAKAAAVHAEQSAGAVGAPWMRRKGSQRTVEVQADEDGVRLVNVDHAGHLMEWGSANNPPHAPLRRGVRAVGLELKE